MVFRKNRLWFAVSAVAAYAALASYKDYGMSNLAAESGALAGFIGTYMLDGILRDTNTFLLLAMVAAVAALFVANPFILLVPCLLLVASIFTAPGQIYIFPLIPLIIGIITLLVERKRARPVTVDSVTTVTDASGRTIPDVGTVGPCPHCGKVSTITQDRVCQNCGGEM